MIGIGGNALDADDEEFSEGPDILMFRGGDADVSGFGLGHNLLPVLRRPDGAVGQRTGHVRPDFGLGPLPDLEAFLDLGDDRLVVPGRVGDGDKEGLTDEAAGLPVQPASFLQLFPINCDPLADVNEQVLKIGCPVGFAAGPPFGAPVILDGFLALKTEHFFLPFSDEVIVFV